MIVVDSQIADDFQSVTLTEVRALKIVRDLERVASA